MEASIVERLINSKQDEPFHEQTFRNVPTDNRNANKANKPLGKAARQQQHESSNLRAKV
jgi:hypothetical protein